MKPGPLPLFAIVTGGGTAGHVAPALSVAEALVARGHDPSTIHFVGSARGMEGTLVPEAGFAVTLLPGRGIIRRLTPDSLWANAVALAGLSLAFVRALGIVARSRPRVVVSVGGYASVPCTLAAALLRVPIVVVSYDAVPGAASRLAGRVASASAVAFDGSDLPRAVVTGTPVRPEVLAASRSPEGQARARSELGLPAGRRVVAVTSGSLGARRVNDAALGLAERWSGRSDLILYHAVGKRDFADISRAAPSLDGSGLDYRAVAYEPHLPALLAACTIAVARAGASTVAELTVVGAPSVLVPLPGAPSDHQRLNAAKLADAGAAVILEDAECNADRLQAILDELLADEDRLERMSGAALSLGRRDAAEQIAALVDRHSKVAA
jgi:UDP-N-acetylglucosamine--N-acetylmuramyl-(pentapeptide) pyrophosphoryl-undecaprenol N-acetylglucosamine transferase